MFDNIMKIFKKFSKAEKKDSKSTAKERLHLVLMQDRANVSADFMELMKQEIIEVIKKYIDVEENSIDVKLTNKINSDGTTGAPILYANIPIISVKDDTKQINIERKQNKEEHKDLKSDGKEKQKSEQKKDKFESKEKANKININKKDTKKEVKKEVLEQKESEIVAPEIQEKRSEESSIEKEKIGEIKEEKTNTDNKENNSENLEK